jgi:phosphatidate cytidylyltransferase
VTRILSGAVLGGLVAAAILWAPSWIVLAIAILFSVLAIREFGTLAQAAGTPAPWVTTTLAAVIVCVAVPGAGATLAPVIIAVVLAQSVMSVGMTPDATTLARVSVGVFGPLYIGLPLGALVAVHRTDGPAMVLLLIATIVISDTAQYYGGRAFGRTPLAPIVSPKKTVEGAVSGLIVGTAAYALIAEWLTPAAPWSVLVGIGLAIVVLGITGDLFESMLKRGVGAKDSSALIPGHGGVLDRIDAILFAAPVYYVILRYAIRTT